MVLGRMILLDIRLLRKIHSVKIKQKPQWMLHSVHESIPTVGFDLCRTSPQHCLCLAFVPPEKFAAFDLPNSRNIPTQSGVDTSPFVQPERFTQLEVKAPVPTKEEMEQMEAPRVTTPLQSVQVNEGSPVLLQATVVGKPRPNVSLFYF